jgi:Protein of unknown function DUF262/HNH endonuclease
MPKHFVNLDALIPREYFEAVDITQSGAAPLPANIRIPDLAADSFFYPFLRKPEFQRETSNWEPEKVADLVQGFLRGDLIPAVILWRSSHGDNFVIDGAHRLSAFIAWVRDDYGDKEVSRAFFNNQIPPEQANAAQRVRDLIASTVGSYADLGRAKDHPQQADPDKLAFAKTLATFSITLQWVNGDASRAEESFFKINQQATLIDPTELTLIKNRRHPDALATRALVRAGTGHKYWSGFDEGTQREIESIARSVYETLFVPALEEPLKTLDLPVAGRGYSPESVKTVLELVKSANHMVPKADVTDDVDGSETIKYLKAVKRAASWVAGQEPRSLGLHPVVYFYSATGRFNASAFLAAVAFVQELEETDQLAKFTKLRQRFEEYLLNHQYFMNQIARKYGALTRGVPAFLKMYRTMLQSFGNGRTDEDALQDLRANRELFGLQELPDVDNDTGRRADFSRTVKNAAFLRQAIDSAPRCNICHARMHMKSISIDHVDRKEDGGLGSASNAQLAHPYCNTGYKELMNAVAKQGSGV